MALVYSRKSAQELQLERFWKFCQSTLTDWYYLVAVNVSGENNQKHGSSFTSFCKFHSNRWIMLELLVL